MTMFLSILWRFVQCSTEIWIFQSEQNILLQNTCWPLCVIVHQHTGSYRDSLLKCSLAFKTLKRSTRPLPSTVIIKWTLLMVKLQEALLHRLASMATSSDPDEPKRDLDAAPDKETHCYRANTMSTRTLGSLDLITAQSRTRLLVS